jgi:dimethylglycine dehydrogenase
VVIGGGVVGVSALYHLAKKGWGDDVVLLEKAELTSGSTWHAAGLLPLFNMSYSVGQIHKYSVNLYGELEAETEQPVGFSRVGNIRLAMNQDRMDEYYQYAATAKTIGVDVRFLTPDDILKLWPMCNIDGLVGGIVHPDDGYIQPAELTQALAKGARARGATIYRKTMVLNIEQTSSGAWLVQTDKGDITCEHVVSATGNYARQTGEMVGLDVPVIPVEHQYLVTEKHPELVRRKSEGIYSRALRRRRAVLLCGRTKPSCRVRTVSGRYRTYRTPYRSRDESGTGIRRGRHQTGLQRRYRLYPRRQPDYRTCLGPR